MSGKLRGTILIVGWLTGWLGLALGAQQSRPPSLQPLDGPQPFWSRFSYEQWTPEQAIRLLTDSPWAVEATLVEAGGQLNLRRQYHAQWYSARTLREALVRLRHLQGRVNPEKDSEFLESRDAYQFYIYASVETNDGLRTAPISHFEGITHEELQQGTLLHFSAQEYRARPDYVELVRNAQTDQLAGIRLTFERAVAGVPASQARRGRVRLVCPTPRGTLTAVFDLSQMVRDGQPDLR